MQPGMGMPPQMQPGMGMGMPMQMQPGMGMQMPMQQNPMMAMMQMMQMMMGGGMGAPMVDPSAIPLSGQGAHRGQRTAGLFQRLDGGLHAGHHIAVELHLFAHVPVERARHHFLDLLREPVERPATARIDGSDGRHLGFGGVARVQQRRQVRERDIAQRRPVGITRTHALPDFSDYRREFFTLFVDHAFSNSP